MADLHTAPTMGIENNNKNPFENDHDDYHHNMSTNSVDIHNVFPNEDPLNERQPITNSGTNNDNNNNNTNANAVDREQQRMKRLKEEAVRRLVSDVNRTATLTVNHTSSTLSSTSAFLNHTQSSVSNLTFEQQSQSQDELLICSTVATAIERNLDRELHYELTKQMKESASIISKICHEHSDSFLHSVGKVVAMGEACKDIKIHIDQSNNALVQETGSGMLKNAQQLEYTKQVLARAKTVHGIVKSCREVALLLERARKQAALSRPKSALDAVDEARGCLTTSLKSIVYGGGNGDDGEMGDDRMDIQPYFDALLSEHEIIAPRNTASSTTTTTAASSSGSKRSLVTSTNDKKQDKKNDTNTNTPTSNLIVVDREEKDDELRLDDTPFGARAINMLPKIENEVLMGARRGLNKWFLSIRSGGDGSKAGRAALRKCAHSLALGPGQLGQGGDIKGYTWRAKNADNLISRVSQNGKVARAVRMGYWFERDNRKEIDRLERIAVMGMERRAEAFASAFGWYRCWDEADTLDVEELQDGLSSGDPLSRSGHAIGRSNSMKRSGHGLQTSSSRLGLSLSYRAAYRKDEPLNSKAGIKVGGGKKGPSQWSVALTPAVLFNDSPNKDEDEAKLMQLPNSVYPVRRAEAAFALQGKTEEFRQYYEQNRFGDMKIGEQTDDDGFEREKRSSLSSLTGDDVSQGTDRIFFARNLPHLCTSVVGFSAIEAALELGNHQYDENGDSEKSQGVVTPDGVSEPVTTSFRESSARYERKLINELGYLLRGRAIGATLVELSRASCLMSAFRAALKIVHPSSTTRNHDQELIAMDVDILMTALKVAQEEQRRATSRIILEDSKDPVSVPIGKSEFRYNKDTAIPAEEVKGFPFGLAEQKQSSSIDKSSGLDSGLSRRSGIYSTFDENETFNFSQSVPLIVKAIHSRAIAFAAFASSQEELGQVLKKGGGITGYILDCVEQLIMIAAVGIKENSNKPISNVQEATQIMANISALKSSLPRLFGVIMRGLFHLGMARGDQLEESFEYAESTLKRVDEYCESQTKSVVNSIHSICQNKVDELLRFSLENFQWVARSARDSPNTYCEGLMDYLRTIFKCLK